RATNPLNKELHWASINGFCEQLNEDFEGCGKRFHDEVGKFRFLNELIKVVSPKYLGSRTSEKVKNKILELLYSWTVGLPEEVKIAEAYQMLKKQDDATFPLPPPRPKNVIFEDEEKSKMLARLLKSSHPEDLRAANKLIKEMVQEDQKRMEKISKRVSAIEEVNNNVKLLTEMILQANDNLTQVINLYKQLVRGEEVNGDATAACIPGSTSALLDLSGLDLPPVGTTDPATPTCPGDQASLEQPSTSVSLLDDELMSLGLSDPTPPSGPGLDGAGWNSFQGGHPAFTITLEVHLPVWAPDCTPDCTAAQGQGNSLGLDPLPGRSDVLVVVVSMLSTAPQPIRNIVFQSAVPKVMKVKLQPPSGTELPAFNPIVHPSAITQVLLLANPQKEKVRLRYKLLFTMGDQTYNEMGDVDQFPPPETWGSL
ncbi:hypothetical protein E2I00_000702, partial [Balaenoptera physalus]